jgi:hypothetical protein
VTDRSSTEFRPSRNAFSGSMIEKFSASLPASLKLWPTATIRPFSAAARSRACAGPAWIVPVSWAGRKSERSLTDE